MKFYPRDWRGDQALRAVSIAARGLWMECLCIMHEAKPYGHLVLNGDPVGDDALARMAGVPVDEVHQLLLELRQAGVLSVTRKGVIFSRRMTKDHARAQKGKTAVEKRWKQQDSTDTQASDTKQKSDAPNRYPNRNPITQKPEARSQNTSTDVDSSSPSDFDRFWQAYPKKVEKKAAKAKFSAAVKSGVPPDRIISSAAAYSASDTVQRGFVKNPTTWLNAGCWDDEAPKPPIPQQIPTGQQSDRDKRRAFLRRVAGDAA